MKIEWRLSYCIAAQMVLLGCVHMSHETLQPQAVLRGAEVFDADCRPIALTELPRDIRDYLQQKETYICPEIGTIDPGAPLLSFAQILDYHTNPDEFDVFRPSLIPDLNIPPKYPDPTWFSTLPEDGKLLTVNRRQVPVLELWRDVATFWHLDIGILRARRYPYPGTRSGGIITPILILGRAGHWHENFTPEFVIRFPPQTPLQQTSAGDVTTRAAGSPGRSPKEIMK